MDLMINATASELSQFMMDSGKQALIQLNIENQTGLVNQVNADSLAYAKDRAAEMVGKKYVNGQLVDNHDAQWVISDTTRDEINGLVSDVMAGNLDATDLPKAIMDSDAFSAARANMIARTELITANAKGSLAGYKAAKGIGVDVMKAWHADDDPCEDCQANEDEGPIDLDDTFPSGDDAPAAHPNCECVLVPVVNTPEGDEEEDDDAEDDDGS